MAILSIINASVLMAQEVDSDYLFLYQAKSTIPDDVGFGVFAKMDIPPGEVICELRGPAIETTIPYMSNKKFHTVTPDGKNYNIMCNNLCSMLNDAVMIVGSNYTAEDIEYFKTSPDLNVIPTYPGFSYNANYIVTKMGKVFIYSTALIQKDTEIFFPYGK